jgi:hypothetical protein
MIFGREPAVVLTVIATGVRLIAAFAFELSTEQQSALNAIIAAGFGLIIAFKVKDGQLPAILGIVQAMIALAIGFGLDIAAEHQALIMSFVGTAVALFVRTQVVAPVPPPIP